jgi:hypothetical protein
MNSRTCTSLMLVLWLCQLSKAQAPTTPDIDPSPLLTREQAQQDVKILRAVLEEAQPALYRYTPKSEIDKKFDDAIHVIGGPRNERTMFSTLTGILSIVKDGHTGAYLPGDYRRFLKAHQGMLPLKCAVLKGSFFVLASAKNVMPPGSRLESINGHPMSAVLAQMLSHLSGDADIVTQKYAAIGRNFPLYYFLFVEQPQSFAVLYQTPSGVQARVTLDALPDAASQSTMQGLAASDEVSRKPLRYEALPIPHSGKLVIETFSPPDIENAGQDFAKFIAATFAEIRQTGITNLVIDVRGNDGGDAYGPLLYSYLATAPFKVFDSEKATSTSYPTLHQYSHLDDSFQKEFVQYLKPEGKGRFELRDGSDVSPKLKDDRYTGRVWFLTDGDVFSATAEFCSVARFYRRGPFIGEETGGAYHGNTSGETANITLPNSKIRVSIPLVEFQMETSDHIFERRGIIPQFPTPVTIQDLLASKDPAIEKVLTLIREQAPVVPNSTR